MNFKDQLRELWRLPANHPASCRQYLKDEAPEVYDNMFEAIRNIATSRKMDCCEYDRTLTMMKVWCGGVSMAVRLHQMYGEADDLRDILYALGDELDDGDE